MKALRSHTFRILSGLALGILLVWLAFRQVEWEAFRTGLSACRWEWVAASMAAGLCALVFRGFRWRRLLLPVEPRTQRMHTIGAYCIGNLCNCALPASGELVRSAVACRDKSRYDKVLGTAAAERVVDLLTLGSILLLLAVFGWRFIGQFVIRHILEPLALSLQSARGLAVSGVILLVGCGFFLLLHLGRKWTVLNRARAFLQGMWKGIASIRQMPGKGWFLLDTVCIWSLYWLQIIAVSQALSLGLLPKDALLLSALGSIASVIPVPGGIGAYHYIIALTLQSLYGMEWNTGILFATLCHESQLMVSILSGALSWLILPTDKAWTSR